MADLVQRLTEMKMSIDDLQENQRFVTNTLQSLRIVQMTHSPEKLRALRNAVLNSIAPPPFDESLEQVFLSYVDSFTDYHIRFLAMIAEPNWPIKQRKVVTSPDANLYEIIYHHFPQLQGSSFVTQVFQDLNARGLLEPNWDRGFKLSWSSGYPVLSPLGRSFLKFISEAE